MVIAMIAITRKMIVILVNKDSNKKQILPSATVSTPLSHEDLMNTKDEDKKFLNQYCQMVFLFFHCLFVSYCLKKIKSQSSATI